MNEWISVKDRLPPNHNDVLIFNTFNCMEVGCLNRKPELGSLWQICGCDIDDNFVTHWMPLPNKPKEIV